jgi:hypothetical protein
MVSRPGRGDEFEAQNVTVEMDSYRHIENLDEGSTAPNINGHI